MDIKLFSRDWIYQNIFDFSDDKKAEIFANIIEDTKQKFRMEQIETEGQDPAVQPVESSDEDDEMARPDDWGGSEKEYFGKDEPREDDGKVQKRHRSFGKREFKGKSPLAQSKASTVVAREGMLSLLKDKFPQKIPFDNPDLLSEENIIED